MHQAESSSSLSCLWTGHSLPAALHPVSRRRSCLRLRTDQCFCPIGTFTLLLVRTFRRTIPGTSCQATIVQSLWDKEDKPIKLALIGRGPTARSHKPQAFGLTLIEIRGYACP